MAARVVGELAGGGGCGVAAEQHPGGVQRLLELHNTSQVQHSLTSTHLSLRVLALDDIVGDVAVLFVR